MGTFWSKKKHIIYSVNFNSLTLTLFDCETYEYTKTSLGIYKPYENLMIMESISTFDGKIYILGGRCEEPAERGPNIKTAQDSFLIIDPSLIGDKKHQHDLAGYKVDNLIAYEGKLPEPRYGHLLIATTDYIYIIGGYINGIKTRSCLRLNLADKTFKMISNLRTELNNPCGLCINNKNLYIFDTTPEENSIPRIHSYVEYLDLWIDVEHQKEFNVPLAAHLTALQIDPTSIMVVGTDYTRDYYYYYDIKQEKTLMTDFKVKYITAKGNNHRQGNVNYEDEDYFYDFGEYGVIVYDKITRGIELIKWQDLEEGKDVKGKKNLGANCCTQR